MPYEIKAKGHFTVELSDLHTMAIIILQRHGLNLPYVFDSPEAAEKFLARYAKENWDDIHSPCNYADFMPGQAVEHYFDKNSFESYEWYTSRVETLETVDNIPI